MTNRPEQETIGCAPAGDRSMIESRRCPKASPASLSVHAAHPSGPRYAIAFAIEIAVAASSSGERRPRRSHTPVMPHIRTLVPQLDAPARLTELYRLPRPPPRQPDGPG